MASWTICICRKFPEKILIGAELQTRQNTKLPPPAKRPIIIFPPSIFPAVPWLATGNYRKWGYKVSFREEGHHTSGSKAAWQQRPASQVMNGSQHLPSPQFPAPSAQYGKRKGTTLLLARQNNRAEKYHPRSPRKKLMRLPVMINRSPIGDMMILQFLGAAVYRKPIEI